MLMTEEADIFSLLRIVLARKPSEQAVQDLVKVPVRQTLLRMLVSDEFADNILNVMLRDKELPHEAKSIPLSDGDLLWIRRNVPLSDDSLKRLENLSDWYELFLIFLSDRTLDDALTVSYNQTARLARMRKRGAAVLAAGRPKPIVRAKPIEKPKPKPKAVPAPAPVVETPVKAAEPSLPSAKNPKIEPVAAPVVIQGAYEAGSGRKLLDDIRDGLDYGAARNALHDLFKRGATDILWLQSQTDAAGLPADIAYLIRYIAVRAYMRQEMFETAFTLSNELLQQEMMFRGLLPVDQARLYKMHALAALRSGRADRAVALYREMLVRYPEDWEVYYQLADNLGAAETQDAVRYFQYALRFAGRIPPALRISAADFLARNGEGKEAMMALLDVLKEDTPNPDVYIGLANLAFLRGDAEEWRRYVARYFEVQGLASGDIRIPDKKRLFTIGEQTSERRAGHPKISVIVTCYNAERTINQAVRSVCNQTLADLEIIVVDDSSKDRSRQIVKRMAGEDGRIKLVETKTNSGTYSARNLGIGKATGAFIAFHDSDDWMHPQHMERHLAATTDGYVASISNLIRMREDGFTIVRKGGGFRHNNPSSTFFRREVFDTIGLFDAVRAGADSEMLWRIRHHYGNETLLMMEDVLSIGLYHTESLTTKGATAFDEYRYSPVRLTYSESWNRWHFDRILNGEKLFMPDASKARAFAAPSELMAERVTEPAV